MSVGPEADRVAGESRNRLWMLVAGMLIWAGGAALFFRIALQTGFSVVSGNGGDGLQNVYVQEHVYQWLLGRAEFDSPPFYYPQQHALGYFDAFLLNLPPYAALRLVGLDPFLSEQLLLVILSLLCFWSTWHLLTKYARTGAYIAFVAAELITFPNNLFLKANGGHLTTFAIYYIPPIVAVAARGLSEFPRITLPSAALIVCAVVLYALLFSTGYYMAWLFALTLLIASLYSALRLRRIIIPWVASKSKVIFVIAGLAAVGFAIGIIPFFIVHGPVLGLLPGRSIKEYVSFAPFPYDGINVSSWNAVWGWFIDMLLAPGKGQRVEQALAVTPGMTLIFLAYTLAAARARLPDAARQEGSVHFATAAVAVLAVSWLLTLRVGSVTPFWLLYHTVPGASAIRVGGRIQLVVNLWIVAALAVLIDRRVAAAPPGSRRFQQAVAAAVLVFCLVEQLDLQRIGLPRGRELAALDAVPTPPEECHSFAIDEPGRRPGPGDHAEAMWISMKTRLPTINGTAPWLPSSWRLDDPSIDYLAAIRSWIKTSNLPGRVCLYDRQLQQWSLFDAQE